MAFKCFHLIAFDVKICCTEIYNMVSSVFDFQNVLPDTMVEAARLCLLFYECVFAHSGRNHSTSENRRHYRAVSTLVSVTYFENQKLYQRRRKNILNVSITKFSHQKWSDKMKYLEAILYPNVEPTLTKKVRQFLPKFYLFNYILYLFNENPLKSQQYEWWKSQKICYKKNFTYMMMISI